MIDKINYNSSERESMSKVINNHPTDLTVSLFHQILLFASTDSYLGTELCLIDPKDSTGGTAIQVNLRIQREG